MKSSLSFSAFSSLFPRLTRALLAVVAAPAVFAASQTDPLPFVSPLFGDHMVMQRGKPNRIWGWTKAGEEVRVKVGEQSAQAKAGPDGRWEVAIQPPPVGGPYTMTIDGPQKAEFRDVLVGDVWLCGGQSNMEMGMTQVQNAPSEIKAGDQPQIRLFLVRNRVSYVLSAVPEGAWRVCSPEALAAGGWGGFSAVGYYFGRALQRELNVPIGLVQACVGGTPAESWTSPAALRALGDFNKELDEVERLSTKPGPQYGNFISHWYDEFDVGQKGGWFAPGLDESEWKTVEVPGGFRELGVPDTPAVVYFRRAVELPDPLPVGDAKIELGVVERMDTTEINGRLVGASSWVENPRSYVIPPDVLKPGNNLVVVRVLKTIPGGGFESPPEKLRIVLGDGREIPLAGEWKARVAVDARPPHPVPDHFENWPIMPAVLYNGMIAPVAPLAITGAIWYQGEANAERPAQYRRLLPAMIADWRKAFGQGDFPFYIVSLAAFMKHNDDPAGGGWADVREVQAQVAETVPNSGLAVVIDKGDAVDIHPKDKRTVGERLALRALAGHYGSRIPFSGPVLKAVEKMPGALRLRFDHVEGGLVATGDRLEEFAISGVDGKWTWADARIDGDTVIVSSAKVPEPENVRYAWQSNPKATLFNRAGLPAVPFRTDTPGVNR